MNSQQQIIKKINEYSASQISFFLFIDFEMQKPLLFTLPQLAENKIKVVFPEYSNVVQSTNKAPVKLEKLANNFNEYIEGFSHVMQQLKYGNSYLTNLTGSTRIETSSPLSKIFDTAQSAYKINFNDEWVCFSPECFIKIQKGEILSFPMKGTIDASLPNAMQTLLEDKKEIAEHYTIVDLIRNDLSMVASNVVVEKFRYVEKIKSNDRSLLQVSSKIKGLLPSGYQNQLGEILFSLLPAGSISGAPKAKTVEIIQKAEQKNRGYYTGVALYFDGETIDSCVLIRFIEKAEDDLFYRSGGGITVNSECEKEYQELLDKIYVPIY